MTNIPKEITEYMSAIGSKGGKKSLESMTPEERRERAKKAIAARWAKRGDKSVVLSLSKR